MVYLKTPVWNISTNYLTYLKYLLYILKFILNIPQTHTWQLQIPTCYTLNTYLVYLESLPNITQTPTECTSNTWLVYSKYLLGILQTPIWQPEIATLSNPNTYLAYLKPLLHIPQTLTWQSQIPTGISQIPTDIPQIPTWYILNSYLVYSKSLFGTP